MMTSDPESNVDKLIAVDLDGTLVAPGNSVSQENLAAVGRARGERAAVVVVTGRPYVSADAVARRVGLPRMPLATFNGGLIRWPQGGGTLRSCPVPAGLAEEVVQECHERNLHLHYYLDDELFVSCDNDWARMYCERTDMSCREARDMRVFAGRQPFKLLVVDHPETIKGLHLTFHHRWKDRLYVTRSMPEYLEFLDPAASKGEALDWLADFYGIRRENILAIGDALNDLPLLERAGHAAAMPNGDSELKQIAAFVPDEQRTGVAAAIDWFLDRQ
jgi:Cof subfamily protein (haloacid dehalogenase superfamily)